MKNLVSHISPLGEQIYFWFWIILAVIAACFLTYGIVMLIKTRKNKHAIFQETAPARIGLLISLCIGVLGITTYTLQPKDYHYHYSTLENNDISSFSFQDFEDQIIEQARADGLVSDTLRADSDLWRLPSDEINAPIYLNVDAEGVISDSHVELMLVPNLERDYRFLGTLNGAELDFEIANEPFYFSNRNASQRVSSDPTAAKGQDVVYDAYDDFVSSTTLDNACQALAEDEYLNLHFSFLVTMEAKAFTSDDYVAIHLADSNNVFHVGEEPDPTNPDAPNYNPSLYAFPASDTYRPLVYVETQVVAADGTARDKTAYIFYGL